MKRLNFVLFLVCTFAINSAARAAEIRTVALSGQQAPGMPDGVNFTFSIFVIDFVSPLAQINDAGQTAFYANVPGGLGIWSEGSGSLALVARNGDHAPGTPDGVSFRNFRPPSIVLNGAGQTAFAATLTGSGVDTSNDWGGWSKGSGSLALVARGGSQAPGLPSGVNFKSPWPNLPVLNDAGQIAFRAELAGNGVDFSNFSGIWSDRSGSMALVARQGDPAPGLPSGVNYGVVHERVAFNNAGQIAFYDTGVGIWSDRSGSLALVARGGDHAPGTPEGVNFSGFDLPLAFNNAGQTAFRTRTGSSQGIWSEGSGSMALIALEGSQAPGMPEGVNFTDFSRPVLNDAGQTAFYANVTGGSGIWSDRSGSLALVARGGDPAPGTTDGVNFSPFNGFPALNEAGQIAFYAGFTGSGVDATNNRGIFATDRSGDLQLIARMGDLLEVAPGDFRTVSRLDYTDVTGINSNGRPSWFNNRGQLAFAAVFTDGTAGIFVSNRVAVPEPASFSAILICTVCLTFHRRRNTP